MEKILYAWSETDAVEDLGILSWYDKKVDALKEGLETDEEGYVYSVYEESGDVEDVEEWNMEDAKEYVKNFSWDDNKEQFEKDVEENGIRATFEEALSDIYNNMPGNLEVGDEQDFIYSRPEKLGGSVTFDFEVVGFDEDLPRFKYVGFR